MIANEARIIAFEKEEWLYTAKENFTPQNSLRTQFSHSPSKITSSIEKFFVENFQENFFADSLTKISVLKLDETSIYDFTNLNDNKFNLSAFKAENKQGHLFFFPKNSEKEIYIDLSSVNDESLNFYNLFFVAEENAQTKVNLLLKEDLKGNRLINIGVVGQAHSNTRLSVVNLGSANEKLNIQAKLNGRGSNFDYYQNSLLNDQQTSFTNLKVFHLSPHQDSDQLVQNFLTDKAKSVFRGSINIQEKCENVSGAQLNKNILLSNKAAAYSIPSLDVANDQVKCAHGSTTGKIDEEELFYLQSRGINKVRAKSLYLKNHLSKNIFSLGKEEIISEINKKLGTIL